MGSKILHAFGSRKLLGGLLIVLAASLIALPATQQMVWLFAIPVFLLTWSTQIAQAANQDRVLQSNPEGAGKTNTVYMFLVFLGGAVGAAIGPALYAATGLGGAALAGGAFLTLAIVAWIWMLRGAEPERTASP